MRGRDRLLVVAERVQRAQLWIAVCALVILMMVTTSDVFLRYLFNRPIRGSYDAVEVMLLIFVFNGMAAGFFNRRNIVIDIVDSFVSVGTRTLLVRIADILSVLCLGILIWAMLVPTMQSYEYGDSKLELRLPIYVMWMTAIVSLMATIFCAFVTLIARPVADDSGHPG